MLDMTLEQRELLVRVAKTLKEHATEIERTWSETSPSTTDTSTNLRLYHLQEFVTRISVGDFKGWEKTLEDLAERLRKQKLSLSLGDSLHFCDTPTCCSYLMQESSLLKNWNSVLSALEHFQHDCLALVLRNFDLISEQHRPEYNSLDRLTSREKEVLRLIVEGLTSKEIAARLKISIKTVEAHRANMMSKLRVNSVVHLVRYAMQEKQQTINPLYDLPKNIEPVGLGK